MRSAATHLLPPALAAFRARHPRVTVTVLDSDAGGGGAPAVRSGRVDLAVILADEAPDLRLFPLPPDEYLFVARDARGTHPVTLAELGSTPLILPPGRDSCHRRIRTYLTARGVSLAGVSEVEQDSVTLSMVSHGLGVSVMPRLALLPLPPGLVALPLPEPLTRPLALAALPHRAGLPSLRAFTQTVLASLPAPEPPAKAPGPLPVPVSAPPPN